MNVKLGRAFAHGQLYVAASRAISPQGLYISPDTWSGIRPDPLVDEFYKNIVYETQPEQTVSRGKGRPSAWGGRKTKTIRVPEEIVDQVLEYAHSLIK